MKENYKKLEKWFKPLSIYPRLNIDEVKKLYIEIQEEKNENTKKILRDKIIYGTSYLIYVKLLDSTLVNIKSPSYDVEDVASTLMSYLIDIIDSGKILKINSFAQIFDSRLLDTLPENDDIALINNIRYDEFNNILTWYFEVRDNGFNIGYNEFSDTVIVFLGGKNINDEELVYLYNSLNGLYGYFIKNGINIDKQTYTYRKLYLEIGHKFYKENPKNIKVNENDELSDNLIDNELRINIHNLLNIKNLSDRERKVLMLRMGLLDGKEYRFAEIGKQLNISGTRVADAEIKALNKLKWLLRYCNSREKVLNKIYSYKN